MLKMLVLQIKISEIEEIYRCKTEKPFCIEKHPARVHTSCASTFERARENVQILCSLVSLDLLCLSLCIPFHD
jgi:hypothetical protein